MYSVSRGAFSRAVTQRSQRHAIRRREMLASVSTDRRPSERHLSSEHSLPPPLVARGGAPHEVSTVSGDVSAGLDGVRGLTPVQRRLVRQVIAAARSPAASWSTAMSVLAASIVDGLPLSAEAVNAAVHEVIRARADARLREMGSSLTERLYDGVGDSSNDRWPTTPEEERAVVMSVVQEAHLVGSEATTVCAEPSRGQILIEGRDTPLVTRLQYQMDRQGVAAWGTETLADTMRLDINWSVALQLLRLSKSTKGSGLQHTMHPIGELYERCIQLMTQTGKTSFGSRPWALALRLYHELCESGNEITPTAHRGALDAVWRSVDRTLLRPSGHLTAMRESHAWKAALHVLHMLPPDHVRGEAGCMIAESAVRALSHMGRWHTAVSIISGMELASSDASRNMLVPTPVTIAEAMSSCLRVGNVQYATTLSSLFSDAYRYRWGRLPHETLRTLLSMARVYATPIDRGLLVRKILIDIGVCDVQELQPLGLRGTSGTTMTEHPCERKVALEALLGVTDPRLLWPLSSTQHHQPPSRWISALRCIESYHSNLWSQRPVERKRELSTLFFCVRRVSQICRRDHSLRQDAPAATQNGPAVVHEDHSLERIVRQWISGCFGDQSPEMEWYEDSVLFRATEKMHWWDAMKVFTMVTRGGPRHTPYLPVPIRQIREHLASLVFKGLDRKALLRRDGAFDSYTAVAADDPTDEADQVDESNTSDATVLSDAIRFIRDVLYPSSDDVRPRYMIAALLMKSAVAHHELMSAEHRDTPPLSSTTDQVKASLEEAGLESWSALRHLPSSLTVDAAATLRMSQPQIESLLYDMHDDLRRAVLLDASNREMGVMVNEIHGAVEQFSW